MKKVLIVNKFLPQYRKEFFNQLRTELGKHSIELVLIYGKPTNNDALKQDDIDIEWATYIPNRGIKIGNTELLWQPCIKHLKGKDLVIVEEANRLIINYYLMFAKYFSKYKLAFWGHGKNFQKDIGSLRNRFKYLFINKCDWWFGYTNKSKSFLLSNNFPENKITVVQNAIDTIKLSNYYSNIQDSELNEIREHLDIKNNKTGIYCGAMYPDKNFDFILETCLRVKKEIPDFNMIFIGSGIESNKIKAFSKLYKWIHYIGPKFGNDRTKYFKISLIQIMPYSVGLAILDSFAMETPMITTSGPFHGPEIEYIENGINGFISNDNIDDYSKDVIEIIKNEKYKDLIKGCKSSAKKYTLEIMVQNYKNGILSCLND